MNHNVKDKWGKRVEITNDLLSIPIEPHDGTSYLDESHEYPAGYEKPYYIQVCESRFRESAGNYPTFADALHELQVFHKGLIDAGWQVVNQTGQMWSYCKGIGLYNDSFDVYVNKQLADAFNLYRGYLATDESEATAKLTDT